MATFEITGSDGAKYRVEGDNIEGAVQALTKMLGETPSAEPKTIATTQGGGRIMVTPDGQRSFASPGYATTDPAIIDQIMKGATQADVVGQGFDEQVIRDAPGGVIGGAVAKAGQNLPYVGQFIDEGLQAAGVDPRGLRQLQGAMDRARPKTSLGSAVTGAIVGSAPLALAGADRVMRATTTTGKIVSGGALGVGFGLTEGAASGAGRKNDGDRVSGAIQDGVMGAAVGGVLGALAPIAGAGAQALARRVKKLDVATIAEEFGINKRSAAIVRSALANEDLGKALPILRKLGDDAMLADAGPASSQLLDAAAQTGGKALRVTREAVEARAGQSGARLSGALDRILGPAQGVKQAAKGIAQRTAKAREAAYRAAFETPLDFSTGAKGEKVLEVLERVPDEFLADAIKIANRRAQMQGDDAFQPIMASIGDDGRVVFSELPSMRQLHELKVGLQEVVRGGTDAVTGKLSPDAQDASQVAKMLRDALVDASPAYRRANRIGGDKIAEESALDMGRNLLKPATTFEDVVQVMRGASEEARQAAKRGLREHIEQTLSNVRRTITDPNTDAREAMALIKALSSRASMKKARMVLDTKSAKALFDELERAEAALALRAATARNSATAVRQGIQGQVADQVRPSLLRRTLGKGGNPLDAARELTETLAGIDPRSMSQSEQAMFEEIAQALTGIRGKDAERALLAVQRAMQGQPLKNADAQMIGRAVVAGTFGAGHPLASRGLSAQQPR